jgi:hypothetical protein
MRITAIAYRRPHAAPVAAVAGRRASVIAEPDIHVRSIMNTRRIHEIVIGFD